VTYLLAQASAHRLPLRNESVQTCVTSPPYWGLRSYAGEQSFSWGGEEHAHEWSAVEGGEGYAEGSRRRWQHGATRVDEPQQWEGAIVQGATCDCGAWYGALGLEPTPDLFVAHMVEIFREVRRVLRRDGTLWLNLGDSYANPDKGGYQPSRVKAEDSLQRGNLASDFYGAPNRNPASGLKAKDLVGIPWRVAFALQADGWYLRSDIVWQKPNPMPSSVTDRPTKSHEYVFLLSKSRRYFYDGQAIREEGTSGPSDLKKMREQLPRIGGKSLTNEDGLNAANASTHIGQTRGVGDPDNGRNARTVWTIATHPYPGAHFATFPPALPEKCVLAGSKPGDVVLDPFNGSGTTGAVALRLGRRYVGFDLSREYLTEQALRRIDPIAAEAQDFRNGVDGAQAVMSL
jgi:DNA modification methylase